MAGKAIRYYLIAGERSGDLHGANLVRAIKTIEPDSIFRGFGGDYMKTAGVDITVHYAELAFMGFAEVVSNLNKISAFIKKCREDIVAWNPDVIILIDYGGFNTRIAKFAKQKNFRVFYYITPKVWAWYQKRALTLKNNVDRMFVILPFEKEFYRRFDWEVDYVGNPVLDAIRDHKPDPDFRQKYDLDDRPLIALLPGSRKQELTRTLPVLEEVARRFTAFRFGVAAVSNVDRKYYRGIESLPNVTLIQDATYDLLQNSKAAIVTSGTATLETGLLRVPQVCVYKTSRISYHIARRFIRVKFISLVNLIAGRRVIRELIQSEANPDTLTNELVSLVSNDEYRRKMISDYDEIYGLLDVGSASVNAAKLITKYVRDEPST